MKRFSLKFFALLLIIAAALSFTSCDVLDYLSERLPIDEGKDESPSCKIEILNDEEICLCVGDEIGIETTAAEDDELWLEFVSSDVSVAIVDTFGLVTAVGKGKCEISVLYTKAEKQLIGIVKLEVTDGDIIPTPDPTPNPTPNPDPTPDPVPDTDPYVGMSESEFYANYTPASSWQDAQWRSQHYFMSGSLTVPDQMMTPSAYQPTYNGMLVHNSEARYEDNGNTYVVLDAYGNVKMRIYRGGAYITLEEVAAYMYAFGGSSDSIPANYTSKKSGKPSSSPWGEYLRCNHSYFSGDTSNYPYEPKLPNISGCGGSLQYYEMDIGTTGTVTPSQTSGKYNNGTKIVRGAARLVYGRNDLNRNGVYEEKELYVFYTYTHYNDFTEYLNYYGGWGNVFGNMTGGGVFDSETKYNPTPYVKSYRASIAQLAVSTGILLDSSAGKVAEIVTVVCIIPDVRKRLYAA